MLCDHRLELGMKRVEDIVILWLNYQKSNESTWDGIPNLLLLLSYQTTRAGLITAVRWGRGGVVLGYLLAD